MLILIIESASSLPSPQKSLQTENCFPRSVRALAINSAAHIQLVDGKLDETWLEAQALFITFFCFLVLTQSTESIPESATY